MLLLRRAVAGLRAGGHEVWLMAPRRAAAILVDPGPGGVQGIVDWEGPEVAALLADGPSPSFAGFLDGVDLAVCYSRSGDLALALRERVREVLVCDPSPPPGVSAARHLALPVTRWGAADPPFLCPSPEEEAAAPPPADLALHPGAGSPAKAWPHFAALARLVGGSILVPVGPADEDAARSVLEVPGTIAARGLPLRVLGSALGRACVVASDSGVAHLAAAFGADVLVLFGPTDPGCWRPDSPRARALQAPRGDLTALEPAAVRAAIRSGGRTRPCG